MINLENLGSYKENNRLEAKRASGGLPQSIWQTYSAFANTNGGVILLGVDETADKRLNVVGLENPGSLRIKIKEAISGGFSNPINSILMKMFNLIDIGERAGSGIPNIYNVWKARNWENPQIDERFDRVERVYLMLPVKKQPIKNSR